MVMYPQAKDSKKVMWCTEKKELSTGYTRGRFLRKCEGTVNACSFLSLLKDLKIQQ